MCAKKIQVNIPGQDSYNVRIGAGVLDQLGASMRRIPSLANAQNTLIITDSNVAPLYLKQVKIALKSADYHVRDISIPAGEHSKNLEVMTEIWEAMASLMLSRDAVVVALGGGVVGDMAGFAAAAYMRGIQVVQCPTTLLAMVDSSVGGKTGVNLNAGKNLVGAFKQPSFVCADTNTLSTLNEREWACGLGEVVKSAVIDGDEFFFWLNSHAEDLKARDAHIVAEAISRCVVFKAGVVAQDQMESKGVRECLNYGHTLAHAIETLSGYGTYSHGHTVAEGMRFAMQLATSIGADEQLARSQNELLDSLGLPSIKWREDPQTILNCMHRDKKSRGAAIRFVLAHDLGNWEIVELSDDDLLESLSVWTKTI